MIFTVRTIRCSGKKEYFMVHISIKEQKCVAYCPPKTYPNSTAKTCYNCPPDCWDCLPSALCVSCNGTTDHRELDPQTKRCRPLKGYFESNTAAASPCSHKCKSCDGSATKCTECPENWTLFEDTCI